MKPAPSTMRAGLAAHPAQLVVDDRARHHRGDDPAALGADWIAPYDPDATDPEAAAAVACRGTHWLGTDIYGRDLLSRIIHAARSRSHGGVRRDGRGAGDRLGDRRASQATIAAWSTSSSCAASIR